MAKSKTTPLVVVSAALHCDGVHIPPFTVVGEIDEDGNITATDARITRGQIIPRKRAGEIVPGDPDDIRKRMLAKQPPTPPAPGQLGEPQTPDTTASGATPDANSGGTPEGDKKGK